MKIWASDKGRTLEENQALCDAAMTVRERGTLITLHLRDETTVKRDKYNSVSRQNSVTNNNLYCYPLITSPTSYHMERAGIKEESTLIAYLSTFDLRKIGIQDSSGIDALVSSVTVGNVKYLIMDKNDVSQFHNSYLYVTLGLFKK